MIYYVTAELNEHLWMDDTFRLNRYVDYAKLIDVGLYMGYKDRDMMFLHRLDGPAYINCNNSEKVWFRRGIIHRLDGVAVEHSNRYFICGKQYQEEEYWEMVKLYKEDKVAFKLAYGFDIEQFFDFKYENIIEPF